MARKPWLDDFFKDNSNARVNRKKWLQVSRFRKNTNEGLICILSDGSHSIHGLLSNEALEHFERKSDLDKSHLKGADIVVEGAEKSFEEEFSLTINAFDSIGGGLNKVGDFPFINTGRIRRIRSFLENDTRVVLKPTLEQFAVLSRIPGWPERTIENSFGCTPIFSQTQATFSQQQHSQQSLSLVSVDQSQSHQPFAEPSASSSETTAATHGHITETKQGTDINKSNREALDDGGNDDSERNIKKRTASKRDANGNELTSSVDAVQGKAEETGPPKNNDDNIQNDGTHCKVNNDVSRGNDKGMSPWGPFEMLPSVNTVNTMSRPVQPCDVLSQEYLPVFRLRVVNRFITKKVKVFNTESESDDEESVLGDNFVNQSTAPLRTFDFGSVADRESEKQDAMDVTKHSKRFQVIDEDENLRINSAQNRDTLHLKQNLTDTTVTSGVDHLSNIVNQSAAPLRTFDFGNAANRESEKQDAMDIDEDENLRINSAQNRDTLPLKQNLTNTAVTSGVDMVEDGVEESSDESSSDDDDDDDVTIGCEHNAQRKCWECYLFWSARQPLPEYLVRKAREQGECICHHTVNQ